MSDDQARIAIICSREFKRNVKKAIADKFLDSFQDGYLQIFELGLKEFKKKEVLSARE